MNMASLTFDFSRLVVSRRSLLLWAIWELNIGSRASVDSWGTSCCHHSTSCRKTADLLPRSVYSHHPFWGIIYRWNVCREQKGWGIYENVPPFTKMRILTEDLAYFKAELKADFLISALEINSLVLVFYVLVIIQNTGSIYERFHNDASLWQRPAVINFITIKCF